MIEMKESFHREMFGPSDIEITADRVRGNASGKSGNYDLTVDKITTIKDSPYEREMDVFDDAHEGLVLMYNKAVYNISIEESDLSAFDKFMRYIEIPCAIEMINISNASSDLQITPATPSYTLTRYVYINNKLIFGFSGVETIDNSNTFY